MQHTVLPRIPCSEHAYRHARVPPAAVPQCQCETGFHRGDKTFSNELPPGSTARPTRVRFLMLLRSSSHQSSSLTCVHEANTYVALRKSMRYAGKSVQKQCFCKGCGMGCSEVFGTLLRLSASSARSGFGHVGHGGHDGEDHRDRSDLRSSVRRSAADVCLAA